VTFVSTMIVQISWFLRKGLDGEWEMSLECKKWLISTDLDSNYWKNQGKVTKWADFSDFCLFWSKTIVCPSKIGVCVWVQIMKRVVVRFFWNFYTIIWHLYTFSFAHWKIFPVTIGFSGAVLRKNESPFLIF
jgi:hypothetical protein